MTLEIGLIKSKLLKQSNDTNTTNNINILNSHLFKYGNQIILNDIINNIFTKIDNSVPTLSSAAGGYFIDITDCFKLKDYNNNTVSDGYYRLKTNVNYYSVGWKNDNYYLYSVKNGLPLKLAKHGYYIDLIHNILTYVDKNNNIQDTLDGYYYYTNYLFISTNNIIVSVPDGYYIISSIQSNNNINNIIYTVESGKAYPYNDYFVNLDNGKYYKNQILFGICKEGSIILTYDKLLIKILNGWKYINLLSL